MLDPIVEFFTRVFHWIGRGIGLLIAWVLWPFMAAGRWYTRRGWIIRGSIGLVLLAIVGFYSYFFWQTQVWTGFNPDYVAEYNLDARSVSAGEQTAATQGGETRTCGRSAIVDVTADLTDFNVNDNAWISSMLLYKLGFFFVLDWDDTPFSTTRHRSSAASIRRHAAAPSNSSMRLAACAAHRRSTAICRMRAAHSPLMRKPGILG